MIKYHKIKSKNKLRFVVKTPVCNMSTKNDNSMSVNNSKFKKNAKRKNNVFNLEWFDIDKCLTMNTEGKKKKKRKQNMYHKKIIFYVHFLSC